MIFLIESISPPGVSGEWIIAWEPSFPSLVYGGTMNCAEAGLMAAFRVMIPLALRVVLSQNAGATAQATSATRRTAIGNGDKRVSSFDQLRSSDTRARS